MKNYIVYNSAGEILRVGVCDSDVSQAQDDELEIEADWPSDIENYIISNGSLTRKSQSVIDTRIADENAFKLRSMRNSILTSCDWTQMPDSPLTDAKKAEWATYRQALRDLPSTTDPSDPTWPTPPS